MAKMDIQMHLGCYLYALKICGYIALKYMDSYYMIICLHMGFQFLAHYLKSFQLSFIGKCSIDRVFRA